MHDEPTFGSLFSGIGGIDLGLERAGWIPRWGVEYDSDAADVLRKRWPDVPVYGDIRSVDFRTVERVDLLAGGFPCQPISVAGRQLAQDDERWLWPEFARAVRELRPGLVFVENVRNLLSVGRGSAFGEILGVLAELGYDAEWDRVSAADVGAPHLRERIWIRAIRRRTLADGYRDGLGVFRPRYDAYRDKPFRDDANGRRSSIARRGPAILADSEERDVRS